MGMFDSIKKIVAGDVAHDAADSGNPIKIGSQASSARPTAVANGDRVQARYDLYGNAWVVPDANYSYAYYYGGGGGTFMQQNDILFQRAATPTWPLSDVITSAAKTLEYFDTDNAAFNANPIWVYVPMQEAGFTRATVVITNMTAVNCDITAYQVVGNTNLVSVGPISALAFKFLGNTDGSHTVATSTNFYIGLGTDGDDTAANRIASSWISGGLLIKFAPASDPPAGNHWIMSIMRSVR